MTRNGAQRRTIVAIAGLLGAVVVLTAGAVGARPSLPGQSSVEVELPTDPVDHGTSPSVSGDGRWVAFTGIPRPASPDAPPDGRSSTVFLLDRATGTTTEVSPVPPGLRPGDSVNATLSGDGCTLVMITELALDVFRDDDTGERWDVYRTTLPHCAPADPDAAGDADAAGAADAPGGWELVSTDPADGSLARDDVVADQRPAVSRSGSIVAYVHPADTFVGAEGLTTISLVDLTVPPGGDGRIVPVAGMPLDIPDTAFTHTGLDQPAISDDGRFVAFRSDTTASEPVPQWGPGPEAGGPATKQVYVWDRQEADPFVAVALASALPNGEPATAGASDPALSASGTVVAFSSTDLGLVPAVFPPCRDGCPSQVYRLDRDVDGNGYLDEVGRTSLQLVSGVAGAPVRAGTGPSSQPSVSADGRLVAFVSRAPNLQPIEAQYGGGDRDGDILVAEASSGSLRRVALAADKIRPTVGAHGGPQLSDSGRVTVFDSLVAGQVLGVPAPSGRNVVAVDQPVSLSMADADLGSTIVGLPSNEVYVAVINDGPGSFRPTTVTVSDPRFRINRDTSTCTFGLSIPAGGDCTVKLTFNPTSPGDVAATLTVAEDGFAAASVSSRVSGRGGEPALLADPAGHDIGSVDFGTTSGQVLFDVENISLLPTSIARVDIVGANASEFAVASNSCADRPLNPQANCSFGVTFTPAGAGRRTAVVLISTPAGQTTSVVVSGDGTYRPVLEVLDDEVVAGDEMLVAGTGYPPDTEVTIVFGDRPSESVTTTTNAEGGFLLFVPVASDELGGTRQLVVQSAGGASASTPVELIAADAPMVGLPGFGLG